MLFICLFLPAVIATLIDAKINNVNDRYKLISNYLVYCFIINYMTNAVLWVVGTNKFVAYSENLFTYDFSMKYMTLTLFGANVLPFILKILIKNVKIEFDVKKGKKDGKKNNK